jgi:hypothetical protein
MTTQPDATHERDLNAATLEEYRRTIEDAAA